MTDKRILIVDDEQDICTNMKDIFDEMGYATDIAHDGTEALRLSEAASYDVVVLDFQMPGMNGAELHNELVKRWPGVLTIMVTAYAQGFDSQKHLAVGVKQVLRKPVDVVELLALVQHLLD